MRLPILDASEHARCLAVRHFRIRLSLLLIKSLLILTSDPLQAHGVIQSPPSRNWFCGAITKPDQVRNGTAAFPVCGEAFAGKGLDPSQGYQFMSVLSHDQGLFVQGPKSNVCSYDSETFKGAPTVWDQAINWPVTPFSSGPQTLTWNIQWGPHFQDTQEFRYWITRADYAFKVGTPLRPEDLEAQPFCSLRYDDRAPDANPDVRADKGQALFKTRCTVPDRKGRHVIYGEWGRNAWTYERFHGCIDVDFGSPKAKITPVITLTPETSTLTGSGSLLLDASRSTGGNRPLRYTWSVSGSDPSLYHLDQPNQPITVLHYDAPASSGTLAVSLTADDGSSQGSGTRSLSHQSKSGSVWEDLGPLMSGNLAVNRGDTVSIRAIDGSGGDRYWPQAPVPVEDPSMWAYELAQRLNTSSDPIRIGVLNYQGQFESSGSPSAFHLYSDREASIKNAYLWHVAQQGSLDDLKAVAEVAQLSPWYGELQVRLSHAQAIKALQLEINVKKTGGIRMNGAYNTIGSQVTHRVAVESDRLVYRFDLAGGALIPPGDGQRLAAQFDGSGTPHLTDGDTYVLRYTVNDIERTLEGHF